MTHPQAQAAARRLARESGGIAYVVYAPEDADSPSRAFFACGDHDLYGYYAGADVVEAVDG